MGASKVETLKAFGYLVRKKRHEAGISQEELGYRSGLDRTYVSGLERGIRNPSLTALVDLAHGFGTSISDLTFHLESEAAHAN